MLEVSNKDQSINRMFRTTNSKGMPALASRLVAGGAAVAVPGGGAKAAVVSNSKDLPDDGNDFAHRDDNTWAMKFPNTTGTIKEDTTIKKSKKKKEEKIKKKKKRGSQTF